MLPIYIVKPRIKISISNFTKSSSVTWIVKKERSCSVAKVPGYFIKLLFY